MQLDRVPGGHREQAAVRAERHPVGLGAPERGQLGVPRGVPDDHPGGAAAHREAAPVRRDRGVVGLARFGEQQAPVRHAPQRHGAGRRVGRDQQPAVRAHRDRPVPALLGAEPADLPVARDVPQPQRAVPAAGGGDPAVGARGDRAHRPVGAWPAPSRGTGRRRRPPRRCGTPPSARPARSRGRATPPGAGRRWSSSGTRPRAAGPGSAARPATARSRSALATATAPLATSSSTLSAATSARSRRVRRRTASRARLLDGVEPVQELPLDRLQPDPVRRRLQPLGDRTQPHPAEQVVVLAAGAVPRPGRPRRTACAARSPSRSASTHVPQPGPGGEQRLVAELGALVVDGHQPARDQPVQHLCAAVDGDQLGRSARRRATTPSSSTTTSRSNTSRAARRPSSSRPA